MWFESAEFFVIFSRFLAFASAQSNCDECVIACRNEFSENFLRILPHAKIPNGILPSLAVLLDSAAKLKTEKESKTVFNEFCNAQKVSENCIRKCGECGSQKAAEQATTPVRNLCVKKRAAFLENIHCYVTHFHDFHSQCSNEMLSLTNPTANLAYITSEPLMRRPTILKEYCSAMTQYLNCYIPSIDHWCGNKASKLMDYLLIEELGKIRMFTINQELQSPIPNECTQLFERNVIEDETNEGNNEMTTDFQDITENSDSTDNIEEKSFSISNDRRKFSQNSGIRVSITVPLIRLFTLFLGFIVLRN